VDAFGRHAFVSKKASGRSIRHHALNELVARAVSAAAIPNTMEPQGLCRCDGKRPDGLTLVPWQSGRSLVWDVTVVCPLADSYVASAAREARSVAELAANKKEDIVRSTVWEFRPVTVADVTCAVQALPDKQCSSDPVSTHVLKSSIDMLAPFLVELFNRSLLYGSVPTAFKAAYITPLLKKPDLEPADVQSCRPISNLSVFSKLLERLVARQLLDYLSASKLLPDLQSAYRAHHSTETAVVKVLADILKALDGGDLTMLTLLDLSAAAEHSSQFQQWSCVEFIKGRSSDRSCFCCTRLTLFSSSRVTTFAHTFMLTILRYMAYAIRRRQPFFERRCLRVWTTSHR